MPEIKNKFILSENSIPDWIRSYASSGRIKFNRDDENKIVSATIQSPTGPKKVKIGDTIMLVKSGLISIPKEKAEKYVKENRQKDNKTTI